MQERFAAGAAPRCRRRRQAQTLALAALGLCLGAFPAHAHDLPSGDEGPSLLDASGASPRVRMRRARFALARGADRAAEADLEAVRQAEPASAPGLEAALLLADLNFSDGRSERAAEILTEAHHAAPPPARPPIALVRGWLDLGRGDPSRAKDHFEETRRDGSDLAGSVAELGLAWAALMRGAPGEVPTTLPTVVRTTRSPELHFAATWTLARAHLGAGQPRRALREWRRARRALRGTSLEDDVELLFGLAQLDTGRARQARRTFERLRRRFAGGLTRQGMGAALQLSDLRVGDPAAFVERVGALYAARHDRSIGLLAFLGALFDRPAGRDAEAAIALAHAAQEGAR